MSAYTITYNNVQGCTIHRVRISGYFTARDNMHVVTQVCDTSERGHLRIKFFDLKGSPDSGLQIKAILFLKSMSERVGSDIERLCI